uniref:Uncharacterized protein n=1 Tax=Chromera velia CCMP2878 TaxID=1169474 RepID=A0A0G4IBE1_9ALVE|eukprot:Cvel_12727.t1-p1 / transcript=Cvel_12727.t1 / gene=Cvel_12727 / organism=Chromera_velia_CCMP2878 / gene_product=hypothetical protein / transcript_product=hypothetical protein / location=Cvel_scaffold845:33286-34177(+) / protein_length=196 / sequence_SO=supercontig / SO=protein_coding / is_pseudo=false
MPMRPLNSGARPFPSRRMEETVPEFHALNLEEAVSETQVTPEPSQTTEGSPSPVLGEARVFIPEEPLDEKQNFGVVNGAWFDQRQENHFNGPYTQNFNQWNGNNVGTIGTVFGGGPRPPYGYYGRRLQEDYNTYTGNNPELVVDDWTRVWERTRTATEVPETVSPPSPAPETETETGGEKGIFRRLRGQASIPYSK